MPLPAGVTGHPAMVFTTTSLAEIMTKCFEGYVVTQVMTAEMFDSRFRRENLDLQLSRVLMEGERPIGIVLVARRGWTARIAAMGIHPDFRGRRLGWHALKEVIDDLRRIGDRRLVLEVIDSNEPALRLYKSLGFKVRRRLAGYKRPAGVEDASATAKLIETDPLMVARMVAGEGVADLPWIMAAETLAAAAASARGLYLSDLAAAIVEPVPQPDSLALRTLVVPRHARGRGVGRRMIQAIAAAYPGKALVVSANFPADLFPGFFASTGFEKTPIGQFEMELDITS